jgi:hypothetical protein
MNEAPLTDLLNALRRGPIGLCAACRYARVTGNARGSRFYLCRLSDDDPRFAKYPRLPVLRCVGFEWTATPTEDA